MSFNEVRTLRKEGNLKEALELAKSDLEKNTHDVWNKRSISWVYYDLLKVAQQKNNLNDFLAILDDIKKLELPSTETMIFDSCAWSVGKLLFANTEVNTVFLDSIFLNICKFEFSKPKDSYSFLLKAFKKHAANWGKFIDFTNWWDLNNFQKKDYENFILDNGKKIPSLAESIYIAISKQLLAENNKEKIKEFIPKIADLSTRYTNMQYPPYYYAKMLIAIGDKEHFLQAFLPFAKKKQRDFWVWDLISEIYEKDTEEYFSCLCKALTCGAPDNFTGAVREKIAEVFLVKEMTAEAKHEFLQIIKSRQKEGWSLRDKHIGWQKFTWWNETSEVKNNRKIYEQNSELAQSLLFVDIKEELLVVERVNNEKLIINFIVSEHKSGFASYRSFKVKPKVGDVYAVRFEDKLDNKSNFYKLLSLRVSKENPSANVYKEISETITIREGNSFGFAKNIFVSPQIIKKYNLKNNDSIEAIVLKSYNKKKKNWGWNVVGIKR